MPEKNSGKSRNTARIQLPHFPFHRFFRSLVEPPSTTSEISNPLNFLLLQTRPNCIGRSWNLYIHKTARQTTSLWASIFATQHYLATQSASNHLSPLYSFRGLPLPTAKLQDARLEASAEENGSKKNTYNAINLPDRLFKTTNVIYVT